MLGNNFLFGSSNYKNQNGLFGGSYLNSFNQLNKKLEDKQLDSKKEVLSVTDTFQNSFNKKIAEDSVNLTITDINVRNTMNQIQSFSEKIANLNPEDVNNGQIDQLSKELDDIHDLITGLDQYSEQTALQQAADEVNAVSGDLSQIKDADAPEQTASANEMLQMLNDTDSTVSTLDDVIEPLLPQGGPVTSEDLLRTLKGDLEDLLGEIQTNGNPTAEADLQGIINQVQADIDAGGDMTAALHDRIAELQEFRDTTAVNGGAYQESGGLVSIQAENFDSQTAGTGSASGIEWETATIEGVDVITTDGSGNVNVGDNQRSFGARVDYTVNFETPGTYYVWINQHGDGNANNSVHVGLDGANIGSYGGQGLGVLNHNSGYEWTNSVVNSGNRVTIEVTEAGEHTFNMWMREDGTSVDSIVLTTDAGYNPIGSGPAESARAQSLTAENLDSLDTIISEVSALAPTGLQETDGTVVIEAENFDQQVDGTGALSNLNWEVDNIDGKNVVTTDGSGKLNAWDNETDFGARLDYTINFDNAGTYYVWVNQHGSGNLDNSVHVGIDGGGIGSYGGQGLGIQNHNSGYAWTNTIVTTGGTRVAIEVTEPGEHTFNMYMREDGTSIDKIILTTDENYTPTGDGPAESMLKQTTGLFYEDEGETRLGNIHKQFKKINDQLDGITTGHDLEAFAQENYMRLKNIMGEINDNKVGDDNYADIEALRSDVETRMNELKPHAIDLTSGESKLERIRQVTKNIEKAAELLIPGRTPELDIVREGVESKAEIEQGKSIAEDIGTQILDAAAANSQFDVGFLGSTDALESGIDSNKLVLEEAKITEKFIEEMDPYYDKEAEKDKNNNQSQNVLPKWREIVIDSINETV